MLSLIIAYFIVCIVLISLVVVFEVIPTHIVSIWVKEIILFVLIVALAFVMLFIPTKNQKAEAVGEAVLVKQFNDADLYYDEANDIYFAVEFEKWDFRNMYSRVEIPRELAENHLETVE